MAALFGCSPAGRAMGELASASMARGRGLPRRATLSATECHSLSLGLRATATASDSEPQGTCPLSLLSKSHPAGRPRGPKHPPHTLAGTRLRQLECGRAQGSGSAARPFAGAGDSDETQIAPHWSGRDGQPAQPARHDVMVHLHLKW